MHNHLPCYHITVVKSKTPEGAIFSNRGTNTSRKKHYVIRKLQKLYAKINELAFHTIREQEMQGVFRH